MATDEAVHTTLESQKRFIHENQHLLDKTSRVMILKIVMSEIGKTRENAATGEEEYVILENPSSRELSIDMDTIDSPEIMRYIYNIVRNRRIVMNTPARGGYV